MNTPINKQAAFFLSRKPRTETVQQAIEGAINHLMKGKLCEHLAEVFAGNFGPEPNVTFSVTIRRDATDVTRYCYSAKTVVGHDIGGQVKLYGLKA